MLRTLHSTLKALVALLLSGSFVAYAEEKTEPPSDEVEYYVEGDYKGTISFGEAHFFSLTRISWPDVPYRCKVGPWNSPNIKSVIHDERCTEIIATVSEGPFVDSEGKPYPIASVPQGDNQVPFVVETLSGQEIYRADFSG